MDRLGLCCSMALLLVYVWMGCMGVQGYRGKCVGQWAIHACGGGNGKRADPSISQDENSPRRKALFDILRERAASAAAYNALDGDYYTLDTKPDTQGSESQDELALEAYNTAMKNKLNRLWSKVVAALRENNPGSKA